MKFITPFLYLTFLLVSCQTNSQSHHSASTPHKPIQERIKESALITLVTKSFNADTVNINTPLTFDVFYTNTGTEPLIISNARTSCSCTVASFSKTPLLSGNTDKIVLKLDTSKPGLFIKSVAIYSNASNHYDESIQSSRIVFKIKWVVTEGQKEMDSIDKIKDIN